MPYKKNVTFASDGNVSYDQSIISGIVLLAVKEIEGVQAPDGYGTVSVKYDKDGIHVDLKVIINTQESVSDIAFKIQENVKHSVEAMTEYHVAKVNVTFLDVFDN